MNSRPSKFIAASVLVLAGFLTFRALQPSPDAPDSSSAANTGAAALGKSGRERIDPSPLLTRLRSLLDIRASDAPDFETVESWTHSLSDRGLRELIEESRHDPHEGLAGWVRCALFAEWGRRDPHAALSFLENFPDSTTSVLNQAAFSIFRGWATLDPEAALAAVPQSFGPFSTIGANIDSYHKGLVAIFNELAKRDPEHALRLVTAEGHCDLFNSQGAFLKPRPASSSGDPSGIHNPHVMTGLFKGLRSRKDLESMVETWTEQVWKNPDTTKAISAHLAHVRSGSREYQPPPPELEVAMQAALSLAAYDYKAAESWMQHLTVGSDAVELEQLERLHLLWTYARPEEAFARIKAGTHPEQVQQYATAVLCQLPLLGPELMAALDSPEIRHKAIQIAASDLAIYSTYDDHPAAGQANRLPDFEANYTAILTTLAAAKLPPDREAELLREIHWAFQARVPAADAAARR